ncbi:hypothetical protein GGF32_000727 [Allomyces javanicus]|nr:hypothetical protein GGF32_000727 [Allomyces javanicus]
MRGVKFGTEDLGYDRSVIHVPWPASLQYLTLDMGRDGSIGLIIARMLPSLAAARLRLKTLELENLNQPDPPLHDGLHAMIQTLATNCPLLCSLQLELPELSEPTLPLEAFAVTTMPLLHHLPLEHVGLVNVGLGDNDESAPVFSALEKYVPRLRSLELTWDRENGLISNALGPVLLQRLRHLTTR